MEQLTLERTAQILMDMYYKDFKTEGDFFDIDFFIDVCRSIYAKLLDVEAKEWRRAARQDTGYYSIDVTPEWLVSETLTLKFDESKQFWTGNLSDLPFAFQFDRWSSGVQSVISPDTAKLERTTVDKARELRHLPYTSVRFWYPFQATINIVAGKDWEPKDIAVYYLPSLTGKTAASANLPVGKHADILTIGFQVLSNVKNGIVDKTNNANPNEVLQTEIDNVFSNTRSKPV